MSEYAGAQFVAEVELYTIRKDPISIDVYSDKMYDSGSYKISDYVYYGGKVAGRRVKLFIRDRGNYRFIDETWSDPVTGIYLFDWIPAGEYLLICDDNLKVKKATTADFVQSQPR